MSIIHFENWDGVTAPSIPSGWNVPAAMVTVAAGPTPVSSPNMIELPSGQPAGLSAATWGTPDTNSGNVSVTGTGAMTTAAHPQSFSVMARGSVSTLSFTSSTFYEARLNFAGSIVLNSVVAGTATALATVSGWTTTPGVFYQIVLLCSGTTLTVTVQRLSDSFWLSSGGTFGGSVTTAISVTNAAIAGAGYAGWAAAATLSSVYGDDWTFATAAGPTAIPNWKPARTEIRGPLFTRVFG